MITRLSEAEATQLLVEDSSQNSMTPAYTVSVIIIEPSDQLSHERLHELVGSSLRQLARFRSRLVDKPLGMGQPLWAQIDEYDPAPQIHRATTCAPGGRREFADLIAQLSIGSGEHSEALWEAWSIDGLAGGRWAVAVKTSAALDDGGIGPAAVWSRLLRSGPHDDRSDSQQTEPSLGAPSLGELVIDTITEFLENYVKGLWFIADAATGALQIVLGKGSGKSDLDSIPPAMSSMSGPVPESVFNAPLTQRRAVAFGSIRLADLQAVSHAFGGTVTNVILAACTLSMRAWLQRHDTVPDDPLLLEMPLALPGVDPITSGNPLVVKQIRIPVQLDDPVQVLTNLHTATDRLNHTHQGDAEKSSPLVDSANLASLIPSTLLRAGKRLYTGLGLRRRPSTTCHGSISYVRGQPVPAYCDGAEVVGMYTVAALRQGCGLNITLTSRGDMVDLSVCVCPDNVPAVDDIATGIADAVDILVAAAQEFPRGQGRSVVTQIASHATKRPRTRRH